MYGAPQSQLAGRSFPNWGSLVKELLEAIRKEMAVIRGAPWSFVFLVVLLSGVIWKALDFRYSSQIDSKNAIIELLKEENSQLKNHPESGQTQKGEPHLTEEQKKKLLLGLHGSKGRASIAVLFSERQLRPKANEILNCLRDSGWDVTGVGSLIPGSVDLSEEEVQINSYSNAVGLRELQKALWDAGISNSAVVSSDRPTSNPDLINIFVFK